MTVLDFLLVLSITGFVWFGFWFGIIHMVGGVVGTVAGAYLAGEFYDKLAAPFEAMLQTHSGWVKLLAFIVIFIAANRLVGFAFYLLDRSFAFLRRIPFLKTINHMGGAILGLFEGALVLGLTLYLGSRVELPPAIDAAIYSSHVAQSLTVFAGLLVPLLPEALRLIQPYIPGVTLPVPQ